MEKDTATALNVLLVEDSEDDRYFFLHAFKQAGITAKLFMANDGEEALEYFQNQGRFADPERFPSPDIVFLDLKMPGRNGYDVLRWMGERSLADRIKVVVLSGSHEPQDMELTRKLGARDYIVKPITTERLQQLLRK
jgi:CheY-like chemotaxis protein